MPFTQTRSRWIVAAWLALTACAAWFAVSRFAIDNGVAVWFGTDDPALTTYRQAVADFGGHEWMLVGLDQGTAPEAARNVDRDRFAAEVGELPHVGMVLTSADAATDSDLVRSLLRPDPFTGMEGVLVQVENDLDRPDEYRERLLDEIRGIGATLPTVGATHATGTVAINGELNRAARRDMLRFFPTVVVLLAVVGILVFGNLRDAGALLLTALVTVTLVAGALAASGYPLNMVTIMLPTVLIALSVADAVHLIHAFHHLGEDPAAAVHAVWKPSLGTTLTTVAGFLAFTGSDVMPIRQLALFGALGIALALAITLTFTPALLVLSWHRTGEAVAPRRRQRSAPWYTRLHHRPRWVLVPTGLSALLCIGLVRLHADTDYATFFRQGSQVPVDYAAMRDAGLPVNALTLVVRPPEQGLDLAALSASLDTVAGVHSVLSPTMLAAPGRGPELLHRSGFVSASGREVQLVVLTQHTTSQELLSLEQAVTRTAATLLPGPAHVLPTGTPYLWARMDLGVIRTQRDSIVVVCVVCLLLLLWLLRSIRLAALTLALSIYPVALVLGLMGWLAIPVNLATVLIAGIAVGIAVDDTIHLVHAWRLRRLSGRDPRTAANEAMQDVAGRMVATSAVLVGAFAVMGFSSFLPTAQFGLLSALVIVLALVVDLTLTPLLLGWGERTRSVA